MAVELGIFPLLLFLMVGGGAFLMAVRTKQSGIAGALIAFAIFAFSSYPLCPNALRKIRASVQPSKMR